MKRVAIILASFIAIASFMRCSTSETNGEASETAEVEEFDQKTFKLMEETHKIMPITNPATNAANFMRNVEADYEPELLAIDFERPDGYYGSTEKLALNLGRMIVDVVYLDAFDQDSLAGGLIRHMEVMSDSLGIARSFNQFLYMRYIDIMDSNDSTRKLILNAIEKSKENLRMENRTKISTLITTGEFFETLFITTQILDKRLHVGMDTGAEKELLISFKDMGNRLDLLISLLESIREGGSAQIFFENLSTLQGAFKEIPEVGEGIINSNAWMDIVEVTAQVRQQMVMK